MVFRKNYFFGIEIFTPMLNNLCPTAIDFITKGFCKLCNFIAIKFNLKNTNCHSNTDPLFSAIRRRNACERSNGRLTCSNRYHCTTKKKNN